MSSAFAVSGATSVRDRIRAAALSTIRLRIRGTARSVGPRTNSTLIVRTFAHRALAIRLEAPGGRPAR